MAPEINALIDKHDKEPFHQYKAINLKTKTTNLLGTLSVFSKEGKREAIHRGRTLAPEAIE